MSFISLILAIVIPYIIFFCYIMHISTSIHEEAHFLEAQKRCSDITGIILLRSYSHKSRKLKPKYKNLEEYSLSIKDSKRMEKGTYGIALLSNNYQMNPSDLICVANAGTKKQSTFYIINSLFYIGGVFITLIRISASLYIFLIPVCMLLFVFIFYIMQKFAWENQKRIKWTDAYIVKHPNRFIAHMYDAATYTEQMDSITNGKASFKQVQVYADAKKIVEELNL